MAAAARAQSGTLTRKTAGQPNASTSTPPSTQPDAPPPAAAAVHQPTARRRCSGSANVAVSSASAAGVCTAAAMPCPARAATSSAAVGASAQASEAAPNPTTPAREHAPRAGQVGDAPGRHEQAAEGQRVRADHPLQVLGREAERAADVRQRDGDDRQVEDEQELRAAEHQERYRRSLHSRLQLPSPTGYRRKLRSVVTELKIVGGDPALDLANTVGDDRVPDPLEDYAAFAAWAARIGVIDESVARRLTARARPAAGGRALAEARSLRATIDAVFRALATGSSPPESALAHLVQRAGDAVERAGLVGRELAWDGDELERPLWPLAVSALDLLRHGPLDRLKACEDCPWLFLDTSRNRSRRWCSMEDCGTRVKMRRYRAKPASTDPRGASPP